MARRGRDLRNRQEGLADLPHPLFLREAREHGPLTVAEFMRLALYHPDAGYYARAARRSGRAGDFFTSVDVGPIFGGLLATQIAEMATLLASPTDGHAERTPRQTQLTPAPAQVDLVEVGAGNGRLSADILRALRSEAPAVSERLRLHLVEASPQARAGQADALGDVADQLTSSTGALPDAFEGVLIANELIDAFPVHQVVMRGTELREVFVVAGDDRLAITEGTPSTPRLAEYLAQVGATLQDGWRAEINLDAIEWLRDVAARLTRGFILLIDYGHRAETLYSASRAHGTLTTYRAHQVGTPSDTPDEAPAWLEAPGEQDITSHVDFTALEQTARAAGLDVLGLVDQTYLVVNLMAAAPDVFARPDLPLKTRMAMKTLMMPGGMGSTFKVLALGKGVGTPRLRGFAAGGRLT